MGTDMFKLLGEKQSLLDEINDLVDSTSKHKQSLLDKNSVLEQKISELELSLLAREEALADEHMVSLDSRNKMNHVQEMLDFVTSEKQCLTAELERITIVQQSNSVLPIISSSTSVSPTWSTSTPLRRARPIPIVSSDVNTSKNGADDNTLLKLIPFTEDFRGADISDRRTGNSSGSYRLDVKSAFEQFDKPIGITKEIQVDMRNIEEEHIRIDRLQTVQSDFDLTKQLLKSARAELDFTKLALKRTVDIASKYFHEFASLKGELSHLKSCVSRLSSDPLTWLSVRERQQIQSCLHTFSEVSSELEKAVALRQMAEFNADQADSYLNAAQTQNKHLTLQLLTQRDDFDLRCRDMHMNFAARFCSFDELKKQLEDSLATMTEQLNSQRRAQMVLAASQAAEVHAQETNLFQISKLNEDITHVKDLLEKTAIECKSAKNQASIAFQEKLRLQSELRDLQEKLERSISNSLQQETAIATERVRFEECINLLRQEITSRSQKNNLLDTHVSDLESRIQDICVSEHTALEKVRSISVLLEGTLKRVSDFENRLLESDAHVRHLESRVIELSSVITLQMEENSVQGEVIAAARQAEQTAQDRVVVVQKNLSQYIADKESDYKQQQALRLKQGIQELDQRLRETERKLQVN